MTARIVVIGAGLSNPSSTTLLADRLVASVSRSMAGRGGDVDIERIELRPLAHALADHMLTGFPSGELASAIAAVRGADGLIVVTPVFSASYSGLFKSFFDVLEPGTVDGKPTIIAATAGTARHQLALDHELRPLMSYLRAVVMPTGVFAAAEDFGHAGLDTRIDRAADELAGYLTPLHVGNGSESGNGNGNGGGSGSGAAAATMARNGTAAGSVGIGRHIGGARRSDFDDPTPFDALLREAAGDSVR